MSMLGGAGNVGGSPLPNVIFPSVFVHYIRGTQPRNMTLRDCNNNLWRVKIEKHGDNWYFTDGWRKFVQDNIVEMGDVLVYEYTSKDLLDFKVLGLSSCEGGIEHLKIRNSEEKDEVIKVKDDDVEVVDVKDEDVEVADDEAEDVEGDDDETSNDEAGNEDNEFVEVRDEEAEDDEEFESDDVEVVDEQIRDATGTGARAPFRRRKRRKNIDYYGAEIFLGGLMPQPRNPYFVTQIRDSRINELYIPADIAKVRNLQLPNKMMLVDSVGRMFVSKRRRWKDGRTVFVGGWKSICRVNFAGKDDKIVCEFVPAPTGDLQMNVSFVRP